MHVEDRTFLGVVVLSGIFLLICGAAALYYLWRAWIVARTLTSQCSEVGAGGRFEVRGQVRSDDQTLISPIGGRTCVYWKLRIEERRWESRREDGFRRDRKRWATIVNDDECVPFFVEDASGRARVSPSGADTSIAGEGHRYSGFLNTLPDSVQHRLRRGSLFGLFRSGIRRRFGRGRLRYEEAVLEVGEEVYVLGDTDRSGGFRRQGWFGGSKGGGFLLIATAAKLASSSARRWQACSLLPSR